MVRTSLISEITGDDDRIRFLTAADELPACPPLLFSCLCISVFSVTRPPILCRQSQSGCEKTFSGSNFPKRRWSSCSRRWKCYRTKHSNKPGEGKISRPRYDGVLIPTNFKTSPSKVVESFGRHFQASSSATVWKGFCVYAVSCADRGKRPSCVGWTLHRTHGVLLSVSLTAMKTYSTIGCLIVSLDVPGRVIVTPAAR